MNPPDTYTLVVNLAQAQTLAKALDLYSRVGIGQLEAVADVFRYREDIDAHQLEEALRLAKPLVGCPRNGHYGIFGPATEEAAKVAWDIHQVLRNRMAWDRVAAEGREQPLYPNVDHGEPIPASTEPLAKITSSSRDGAFPPGTPNAAKHLMTVLKDWAPGMDYRDAAALRIRELELRLESRLNDA